MGLYTFGKEERIRSRSDFLRISKEGTKYGTDHFRVALCPNKLPSRRLGITVGKNIGTAVERNRVKRRIRECFRLNKEIFPDSTDVVITAKKGAAGLNFLQTTEELKGLLRGRTLP
jgi:ribonuclease P protein component